MKYTECFFGFFLMIFLSNAVFSEEPDQLAAKPLYEKEFSVQAVDQTTDNPVEGLKIRLKTTSEEKLSSFDEDSFTVILNQASEGAGAEAAYSDAFSSSQLQSRESSGDIVELEILNTTDIQYESLTLRYVGAEAPLNPEAGVEDVLTNNSMAAAYAAGCPDWVRYVSATDGFYSGGCTFMWEFDGQQMWPANPNGAEMEEGVNGYVGRRDDGGRWFFKVLNAQEVEIRNLGPNPFLEPSSRNDISASVHETTETYSGNYGNFYEAGYFDIEGHAGWSRTANFTLPKRWDNQYVQRANSSCGQPELGKYYGMAVQLWTNLINDVAFEVKFNNTRCNPPVGNLALGASVSATSTFPGYSVSRINDGNPNTTVGGLYSWSNNHPDGGTLPESVTLDFGTGRSFGRIDLYTSSGYELRGYNIQYSSNNTTWTTLTTVSNNTSSHRTHTFPARSARYIRINGTQGPAVQPAYARINEIEVY